MEVKPPTVSTVEVVFIWLVHTHVSGGTGACGTNTCRDIGVRGSEAWDNIRERRSKLYGEI